MSVGSAMEAQHLKWAYCQLLLHLPECHRNGVLVSGNSVGETVLHFPCAAGVGSVVEVGTACRHGLVPVGSQELPTSDNK